MHELYVLYIYDSLSGNSGHGTNSLGYIGINDESHLQKKEQVVKPLPFRAHAKPRDMATSPCRPVKATQ